MAQEYPRYKVFVEGVQVQASAVVRRRTEGMPVEFVVYLWPSTAATQIKPGSSVQVFFWQDDLTLLEREAQQIEGGTTHWDAFRKLSGEGLWKLFADGYVWTRPQISSQGEAVELHCMQWAGKLRDVYVTSTNIREFTDDSNRDRVFLGINPEARPLFGIESGDASTGPMAQLTKQLTEQGIGQAVINFFQNAVAYDDLYARVHAVARLDKRFASLENQPTQDVIERHNLISILTNQIGSLPARTNLFELMNQMLEFVNFTAVMEASPMYKDEHLYQYVYHPQQFYAVPPKCNIVFPAGIQWLETVRHRKMRPTRMALYSPLRILGEHQQQPFLDRLFYPTTVRDLLKRDGFDATVVNDKPLTDRFTAEELEEERISPDWQTLPFGEAMLAYGENDTQEELVEAWGWYQYNNVRNNTDGLSVRSGFDPYLIPGLSGAVLHEKFGFILGRIRQVVDTLDLRTEQHASVIEFANVRFPGGITNGAVDLANVGQTQVENYEELFGDPPKGLYEEKFKDKNLGTEFYQKIFGVESVINPEDEFYNHIAGTSLGDAPPTENLIAKALAGLYTQYKATAKNERAGFTRQVKFRPMVTEGEYMAFVGAEPAHRTPDPEMIRYLADSQYKDLYAIDTPGYDETTKERIARPFMTERQAEVQKYVAEITDEFNTQST